MTNNDLLHHADLQRIATQGVVVYNRIRSQYEPHARGQFLAIEVESGNAYLGASSAHALERARTHHPDRLFYVVKVGFDAAETVARSLLL